MLKRIFDFACAVTALGVLSPVMVLAWILIRLDSPGPALYRQPRFGLSGKLFTILKFRTMRQDSDSSGGFQTLPGDTRITRVGRILRRTSIDELPQLWNIVRGEMSIVGPRPDVPAQRSLYTDAEFAKRHSVRPGLTGLAQSRIRNVGTERQRKRFDLFYADHASLGFDLLIILWTIRSLRKGSF
ncbi:MAG: sugar transferase [Bdellovibrionota bacterium]